jgi:hypothetical protein
MTSWGYRVKDSYNRRPRRTLVPAAALTLFDLFLNNRSRLFYSRREYPIVRALAALTSLNYYEQSREQRYCDEARRHLEWLRENSCVGFSGPCWGLGFDYAVSADVHYDANTPLTTMTPYALEAFVRYEALCSDGRYLDTIQGIFRFFESDVQVMEETEDYLVTSYSTFRDRRVVNAVSYTLFAYSLCLPYLDEPQQQKAQQKIRKLYAFVADQQQADGSWYYSPDGQSFIDCFHSCIILKNLIKASRVVDLPDCDQRVERGYTYLKQNFYVANRGLFKRFSVANKPSLIQFDLYDNAEFLCLAAIRGDSELVSKLSGSIRQTFIRGEQIYSQLDRFGFLHNADHLRWAVLPYLYARSVLGLTKDEAP